MFFINDIDLIIRIIDNKNPNKILIPLYVKVFNRTYGITELNNINDFSKYDFKIGFGTKNNMYTPNQIKFPLNQLQCFYNPSMFTRFDDDTQVSTTYITFESDYIDPEERNDIDVSLINEINENTSVISDYIANHVKELKKERIKNMMEQYSSTFPSSSIENNE